ncbi:hypothetical protein [Comamonas koreensis]|uniref:hypothetical protein n=1 Tax=Comamonas koreensis TaxID=160825 RepID=UPI0015FC993B|nr:hypothetical protein [Comamonas koreensis]
MNNSHTSRPMCSPTYTRFGNLVLLLSLSLFAGAVHAQAVVVPAGSGITIELPDNKPSAPLQTSDLKATPESIPLPVWATPRGMETAKTAVNAGQLKYEACKLQGIPKLVGSTVSTPETCTTRAVTQEEARQLTDDNQVLCTQDN